MGDLRNLKWRLAVDKQNVGKYLENGREKKTGLLRGGGEG